MDFFKLDFCSFISHNFIKIGPNDMFYTKKCNYFSRGKRWEGLIFVLDSFKGEIFDFKVKWQGLIAGTAFKKVFKIRRFLLSCSVSMFSFHVGMWKGRSTSRVVRQREALIEHRNNKMLDSL